MAARSNQSFGIWSWDLITNPNPLGILARNLPESSKILQCTFGNMPLSSKCTMHFRWSFIFSTYGLYFLPGSNFAPFEEVKVPVSKSADFFPKRCPLEDLGLLGWIHFCSINDVIQTKYTYGYTYGCTYGYTYGCTYGCTYGYTYGYTYGCFTWHLVQFHGA